VRGEKNKKDPINFDQIDYRPDVAVGRWPVSTPAEVRVLAAKSLAYEKSILAGTHAGMRQAALFHVGVSAEYLLPGDEVHAVRRSNAANAASGYGEAVS
jgi:hypothetical protein